MPAEVQRSFPVVKSALINPLPIVDHAAAKERTLRAYQKK